MTRARQACGEAGEDLACRELERLGYAVIGRRYRTRAGEIDIVARHAGFTVFVEVKARQSGEFGVPEAAVTRQKQRRLALMATDYLARAGLGDVPCRFDVVAVDLRPDGAEIRVIPDAFRPGWG